jgi:hypothetical protein
MSQPPALVAQPDWERVLYDNYYYYVKQVEQLRNITKSQMGYKFFDKFVEHQAGYLTADAAEQLVMKTEAHEKWMACLLICGSDQTEYGSLLKGFISQFSLGNDQ